MDRDALNTFFYLAYQNDRAAEEVDYQQPDKEELDYGRLPLPVLAGISVIILLSAWVILLI